MDYSETVIYVIGPCDFEVTEFPDCPPLRANCVIHTAFVAGTFAEDLNMPMDLTAQSDLVQASAIRDNLNMVLNENRQLAEKIDYNQMIPLLEGIRQANSVFLIASGRSGFSMRAFAMRLMHLGLQAYFVGDTTTPAIKSGDLLLAASGSGTTSTVVKAAEKAKEVGANVISITTKQSSSLSDLSDTHIYVPAAEKEDHHGGKSKQYAGSLFEQALLLLTDALFLQLWHMDGTPAEELWKRHANME